MEKTIGDNIRKLREERGWTQSELAAKLEVKSSTISSWEVNRTEPSIGMVDKMSKAFGVSQTDIINCQDFPVKNNDVTVILGAEEAAMISAYREASNLQRMKAYALLLGAKI